MDISGSFVTLVSERGIGLSFFLTPPQKATTTPELITLPFITERFLSSRGSLQNYRFSTSNICIEEVFSAGVA